MDPSPGFKWRKYGLITLTSISIIWTIIMFIIVCSLAEEVAEETHREHPDIKVETAKKAVIIAVGIISLFSIAISSIGLFGALKENYCLSFTYSIFSLISLIINFTRLFTQPIYWVSFLIRLGIFATTVLFVIDLRRMRVASNNYA
uniref:Uncharacterized protein LOC113794785 n=1 Tax=Dermatophagoides pteronyssinus TaxID=6956 RepID=A0A6P6Y860_DERPT|nr:uncharacterized protein LOC113794785 [Dermatophagoides pteronyssinus]XP_027200725.1 uncharacterized protein LOC113794785 [Dermatophagoides pteronyssinus]XP_027200726.1 uncharacterized protein LOC113794785 [Dermatophagoides pteronyssinus]